MKTIVDKIQFEHSEGFTGEVEITRGSEKIKVPMEAVVRLVAEKVRHDRIAELQSAKPSDLIKRLA